MTPIAKIAISILIKFEIAIAVAIVALHSPIAIAIILLTVDKVLLINFIGKLVPNNFQNGCLMQPKAFFRNIHSLSSGIFEIFYLENVDC